MVTSLLKHDRIRTTDVKAKELRRWADKIITLAKQGDLHSRRQALAIVREKDVVHKLFAEAADRFGSISGGYTRIVKAGNRPGDAAPVSIVELIAPEKSKKKDDKKKKPKVSAKKKSTASKKAKGVKKEKKASAPAESPAAPVEEKA
jgi:large subunit ribosomal protein L17